MKNIFTLFLGLLFVGLSAQTTIPPTGASTTENYVYSRTYLEAVTASSTTAKQVQGIQYFDGLGRPKQSIAIKASPLGKDVVTPIVYDGFGRQTREYLPIPQSSTTNGTIYTQNSGLVNYPVSDPTNIYASEKIYSEKVLENSPLDRVLQQLQPGNAWSTKPINLGYDANAASEVLKLVTITTWANNASTSTLKLDAANKFYPAAQLYKNTVIDEDGNISIEFKNGQGQTLLVRKVLGTTNADTYYVYNEYNQLAFVLSPLISAKYTLSSVLAGTTVSANDLNDLGYQYRYDGQNRLVEKKLPGKGWEYMVYDQQDRLVLTQDANLGQGVAGNTNLPGKQWLFTKYDQFGRVIYTGIYTSTQTYGSTGRSAEQANVNSKGANNETISTATFTASGMSVYYTNSTAYPTSITKLLSVNYYDNYPSDSPTRPTSIFSINTLPNASYSNISLKELPTASYINNIENDAWTKTYTWYDGKARAIGSHSINYLGGYTKTETELDFAGVPQKTYTYHKRLSTDTEIVIKERFEYDNQNRLVKHWHNVNNAANDELLTFNEYNELGQLKNKKVGGTATTSLQTVDYTYNIRGWMTKINDLANLGTDLFGYNINYNTLDANFSGTAKYNGNIAQTTWKTNYSGADTKTRNYSYIYDSLNRLLDAKYTALGTTNDQNYYNENLTYDLNGNIATLKRNSNPASGTTAQKIDDLVYNYENGGYSNKLNKITLPVGEINNPSGYNALQNAISYDVNGNMTSQLDKNISSIEYNYLNLPNKIITPQSSITYYYRSDGLKYRKDKPSPSNNGIPSMTFYVDGFQYTFNDGQGYQNVLQFVPTAEGYYDFVKSLYIYNYVDHLGNMRVSYYKNPATGNAEVLEENNYYPFGLKHEGYNDGLAGNPKYQYKYNGKELQESGMYDYGARFYMPDIGRWFVPDPLAEKDRRWSPYRYAYDNPIRFIDPDGMWEDWVEHDGKMDYDSRVKSQEDAQKYWGDNATYRAPGYGYYASDSNYYLLGENGSFVSNGATGNSPDVAGTEPATTKILNYVKDNGVFEVNLKFDFGLQGGGKLGAGSLSGGFDVVDIGNIGYSSEKGNISGTGDGSGRSYIEGSIGLPNKNLDVDFGATWTTKNAVLGDKGSTDLLQRISDGSASGKFGIGPSAIPLFKKGSAGDNLGVGASNTLSTQKDCTACINSSVGVKAFLGITLDLKVGFK